MALNFPNSPVQDEIFLDPNGTRWIWNGEMWRRRLNISASGGSSTLQDLTDTTITNPANSEVLSWNGSAWINAVGGGSSDHGSLTGLIDDDHEQYHNDERGDLRYSLLTHEHDADYALIIHTHEEVDIIDLNKYTQEEVDSLLIDKSDTDHVHSAAATTYDNTESGLAATEVKGAIDEITAVQALGVEEYAAIADAATGTIEDDINAMDWTGHAHAIGALLSVELNHIVTFGNNSGTVYRWIGPKPVTLGVGGDHVVVASNLQGTGTTDHATLTNITADAHHAQIHTHDGIDGSGQVDYTDLLSIPATFLPAVHTHDLEGLTDTLITTPATDEILKWNGSKWVNGTSPAGVTDHGLLSGLENDDHSQYHNDIRGDLRYSLLGHDHNIVYAPIEHTLAYHSDVTAPTPQQDQVLTWNTDHWEPQASQSGGVTDHGALNGLADDDHSQYYNQTRGDLRYALVGHDHTGTYSLVEHDHDLDYADIGHHHDLAYAPISHGHAISEITGLQTELDGKALSDHNHDSTYEPLGALQTALETTYDNTASGLSASNVKTAIDEISSSTGSGVEEYGAIADGDGTNTIEVDVNAMDWTEHTHAIGTALDVQTNHIITFSNGGGVVYRWVGVKPVTLGIGGNHTATSADFIATGVGAHDALSNLELADQHGIGVITGLQTALDGKEAANTNIQTHIGIVAGNPHGTTAADVSADPVGSADAVQGNLDTHTGAVNPHGITPGGIGASLDTHNHDGDYDVLGAAAAVQTNLDNHSHTAGEVGAVAANTAGLSMEVVAALPGTPVANTLYIIQP